MDAAALPGSLVVVADAGARRATRWLVPDTELDLAPQELTVSAAPLDPDGAGGSLVEVTVTAATLLRDVSLLAELHLPDAVVSGQLATLLPGERATLQVWLPAGTPGSGTEPDWAALLWSDNRLRHPDGDAPGAAAVGAEARAGA